MKGHTALTTRFIDPKILATANNLHLVARAVVEGFVAGLHRSPYHGFSLEFAEYREYSPGDDTRSVDWKVYARTDRFYVKKFEGDTNTQVFLLVDTSKSMFFSSSEISKIDYARFLAASLAYFSTRQSDAVGMISFDSTIGNVTPPKTRHGQLMSLLRHLETIQPGGETRIAGTLKEFSRFVRKRSLVILISDLYEDPDDLAKALRFFHHRGNDVLLFHIFDPLELDMPLEGVATLEDIETGEQIPFTSEHSREAYLRELNRHMSVLKKECRNVKIDYEVLRTDQPLDAALFRYLSARSRRI